MIDLAEVAQEADRLAYVYRRIYGEFPGDVLQRLVDAPQVTYASSTNVDGFWQIVVTVYDRVCWLMHLEKCPLPARKLRHCYLRRRLQHLKRDKKRYERRYV